MALSLFFIQSVSAAAYQSFGPQPFQLNKYYYFGDTTYDNLARQGLDLSVDGSSVSFQSTKATLTMDYNIINDRQINRFVILANGVAVDAVEPYFDTSKSPAVYSEYYYLDINITTQYIGSDVYFQVIGLHDDSTVTAGNKNSFVVAWSTQTPTYHFKPLPVTDADTHGWLQAIYNKLLEMMNKLEEIKQAILHLLIPSPEAEKALDDALKNAMDKMPMQQAADQIQDMNNQLQQSKDQLQQPYSKLTLGGKLHLVYDENGVPLDGSGYDFIDLTDYRDFVVKARQIEEAALWVFFIYGVLRMLTPKATV